MRNNQPVTNVETLLPENEFIYSRTNLKSVIVEANEAFCQVSGYTREEVVGQSYSQSYNMVRHPDMLEAACADMWRDLKAGMPWSCTVKNRRKDGGFYWVPPVREKGQVVGYQSVRSRPEREKINAAEEAFRRIKQGDSSLKVRHGIVRKKRPNWVKALLSLKGQRLLMGLLVLLLGAVGLAEMLFGLDVGVARKSVRVVAVLYSLYFLFYYVPTLNRDLQSISDWLDDVLSTRNLKQSLNLHRTDTLGKVGREMGVFVTSVEATVQGMADTSKSRPRK